MPGARVADAGQAAATVQVLFLQKRHLRRDLGQVVESASQSKRGIIPVFRAVPNLVTAQSATSVRVVKVITRYSSKSSGLTETSGVSLGLDALHREDTEYDCHSCGRTHGSG